MGSFVLAYIPKGTTTDILTKLVNDGTSFISSSLPQDLMDFVEKKKIAELSQSHAENAPTIATDIFKTNDSKNALKVNDEPPPPVSIEPSPSPSADSSFQAADLFIDDDEEEEYEGGDENNDQTESEKPSTSSVSSSSVEIEQKKDIKEEINDDYETKTPSFSGVAPSKSSNDPFAFAAGKLEELANEMFRDPEKSSIPDITTDNMSYSEKKKRGRPCKVPRNYDGKPRGRPPSEPSCCHVCNVWFETCTLLMEHMVEHPGQKAFKCEVCHDQFTSRSGLKGHMRGIHYGDRPHACDICWHTFVSVNALRMHKNTHSKNKPYQCRECKRKFSQLGGMRAHRKKHHQPIEKAVGLM